MIGIPEKFRNLVARWLLCALLLQDESCAAKRGSRWRRLWVPHDAAFKISTPRVDLHAFGVHGSARADDVTRIDPRSGERSAWHGMPARSRRSPSLARHPRRER